MAQVTAIGELLIDFIPQGGGEDAPRFQAMPGGAPGNFAAAVRAYGVPSAIIAKVGEDAFGDLLLRAFTRCGVDTAGVVRESGAFTTLAFVTLDGDGERRFSFARKPGADTLLRPEECSDAVLRDARLVHFGSLSLCCDPVRAATAHVLEGARAAGKLISYDPNLRLPLWESADAARSAIFWGLGRADIVKISDEEVRFLWDCGEEEGASRILREYGAGLVFVTCGGRGCYFAAPGAAGWVSAPAVRPIDTTGAGDIFFGAAVSRLLRREGGPLAGLTRGELAAVARFACAAASLSTQRHGGIGSIVPEGEVLAALATCEGE